MSFVLKTAAGWAQKRSVIRNKASKQFKGGVEIKNDLLLHLLRIYSTLPGSIVALASVSIFKSKWNGNWATISPGFYPILFVAKPNYFLVWLRDGTVIGMRVDTVLAGPRGQLYHLQID